MVVDCQIYNTSLSNFVMFHYLEQVWLTALEVKCLEKIFMNINQNFTTLLSSQFKEFVAIFIYNIVKTAATFMRYTYMHVHLYRTNTTLTIDQFGFENKIVVKKYSTETFCSDYSNKNDIPLLIGTKLFNLKMSIRFSDFITYILTRNLTLYPKYQTYSLTQPIAVIFFHKSFIYAHV